MDMAPDDLSSVFPLSRGRLGARWDGVLDACEAGRTPQALVHALRELSDCRSIPAYLPDLAEVEWAVHRVTSADVDVPREADHYDLNPTLEVLQASWKLADLFEDGKEGVREPAPSEQWILVWRGAEDGRAHVKAAANEELLAVKMLVEGIGSDEAARLGGVPANAIDGVLRSGVETGFLVGPGSRIRRNTEAWGAGGPASDDYAAAETFTIQWHITQACDLHCKHCYDRTKRSPLSLEQGLGILDDMVTFCRERNVRGHVCFTGGNPLLYPHFYELYQAAADRWLTTSMLGNPTTREKVAAIQAIQPLEYYQVSLEGLPEHNDDIRGAGHFDSVMAFLDVLRELEVSSAVMLTLTADNIDQVLPLAGLLRGRTDYFTFNRLSPVGEGANLALPTREKYEEFLGAYVDAARENPILGFKDNLINIVLHQRGREPFGGCTGFGCGAAFNFLAVLPDGQVHACRKFPSLVGNVLEQSLAEVYDSDAAERYRNGSQACAGCRLRPFCGGCLAVANGLGVDIFRERDPHCFFAGAPSATPTGPDS